MRSSKFADNGRPTVARLDLLREPSRHEYRRRSFQMGRKRVQADSLYELVPVEAEIVHIPANGLLETPPSLATYRPDRPPRRHNQSRAAGNAAARSAQRHIPQQQPVHREPPGPSMALHRGRFAEWSPTAVTSGAATSDATVIAIARASGDIEIWDSLNWNCLKVTCLFTPCCRHWLQNTGYRLCYPSSWSAYNALKSPWTLRGSCVSRSAYRDARVPPPSWRWRGSKTRGTARGGCSLATSMACWWSGTWCRCGRWPRPTPSAAPSGQSSSSRQGALPQQVHCQIGAFTLRSFLSLAAVLRLLTAARALIPSLQRHLLQQTLLPDAVARFTDPSTQMSPPLSRQASVCIGVAVEQRSCTNSSTNMLASDVNHFADGVRLAVACDDGVTRLFIVEEGVPGLTYQRSLGRVEGRALALAWHPTGSTLFSGHSDAVIRAWDAATGREIYRIDASKRFCPSWPH